ncbi:zinc finger, CCHC-type containing protein [Tanacetum coccineum]
MLHFSFDMKDMGEADVILCIRIQKNSNGYILTQSHYIENTHTKFRHYDDRPYVTLFDPKVQLKKNTGQILEGFYDANWISNHNQGKSTSGYVFTLGRVAVSWKSSKQTVNTISTMEAEVVALDKADEEAGWIKSFLEGIPLWPKHVIALCIYCDSMAALTRLDKFEGVDFRRWQKKMHFLLSSMSVVYGLTTPIPEDGGDDATVKQIRKRAKWDNDDYVCRGLILKDFKHTLKHKKDELTLVELGSHLRIEESLRALNIVNDNIGSAFMSTSKLNDSILWHTRLGHVYFKRMQDMSKDGLIPAFDMDTEKTVLRLPDLKLKTLGERGVKYIFVGYAEHSKAFRPSQKPLVKRTEDSGGLVVPEKVTEEEDLETFDEAMKSQDVAFWKEAINDEMDFIIGNNTWVLADLPLDCKPLGGKWIFKRKLKVDETIEKFKAMLVIQGFKQKSGIYYFDTYAPVARISTIRLLIAMTSIHNMIIHQMDVKVDETIENTPMNTSEKLKLNNGQAVSQLEYSRMIGCLMYAMTCTRPDIAFVVGKLSRYTSNSGTQHWQAFQRVLKYLKKTMDYRLTYTGYPSVVVSIGFVRSQRNLADHLTKGLARGLVLKSVEGMGLKSN